MTNRQWQEVESIVRKEQVKSLQHIDTARYDELSKILGELYHFAHPPAEYYSASE